MTLQPGGMSVGANAPATAEFSLFLRKLIQPYETMLVKRTLHLDAAIVSPFQLGKECLENFSLHLKDEFGLEQLKG